MYNKKPEHKLVWDEARQDVALVLRQISERIRNEVLTELDKEFVAALTSGKVIEFDLDKPELAHRFAKASTSLDLNFSQVKQIGGPNVTV